MNCIDKRFQRVQKSHSLYLNLAFCYVNNSNLLINTLFYIQNKTEDNLIGIFYNVGFDF